MLVKRFCKYYDVSIDPAVLENAQMAEEVRGGGLFAGQPKDMCELIGFLGFSTKGTTAVVGGDEEIRRRVSSRFPGVCRFEDVECDRVIYVDVAPWASNGVPKRAQGSRRWYITRYAELMRLGHAKSVMGWLRRTCEETCVEDVLCIGKRPCIHWGSVVVIGNPLKKASIVPEVLDDESLVHRQTWGKETLIIRSAAQVEQLLKMWWDRQKSLYAVVFVHAVGVKMFHACLDTLARQGFNGRVFVVADWKVHQQYADTLFESVDEQTVLKRLTRNLRQFL